jgi:hypothetical protein
VRPDVALETESGALGLDPGAEARRVDGLALRQEEQIAAGAGEERRVAFGIPRIAVEILVRGELRRIDEDRSDDPRRVIATSERWPSCSAPIVGTKAIVAPSDFQDETAAESPTAV